VLIVGASSGIGREAARYLVDRGCRVFGASRTRMDSDGPFAWSEIDVTDSRSVRSGIRQVIERCERLDGLVYCAGKGSFGSVEEFAPSAAGELFDVNLLGALRVIRAVLPHMRKAGAGRIVLVGSLAGRVPVPFQAHYAASKAALESIAFALRNEVRSSGVHVSLVEPGDIRTDFNEHFEWDHERSPIYGRSACAAADRIRRGVDEGPPPIVVARAIGRALTAKRPRARYRLGPYSSIVALARRLLPDALCLRLIRSYFGV
jgi:NAD(P)-dependent dehydrogenase (short-subunit alcohol dehydrogenase family)